MKKADPDLIQDAAAVHTELIRDRLGRQAFTTMYRAWISRSGWSLVNLADLCEAALRNTVAAKVPDFVAGRYEKGDLVVANSWVWIAQVDGIADEAPDRENSEGWEQVCGLRRLYPSQVHNLQLGSTKMPGPIAFDTLGRLNLYLAAVRAGTAKLPTDRKVREKAEQATVIEDSDGPFGPEEFFAVYVGRLQPPLSVTRMNDKQAQALSHEIARKIRQGLAGCGLDLVDDWSKFLEHYPTRDSGRIAKVRDVALGQGSWSAEQVEDESAAVNIALIRLETQVKTGQSVEEG